MKTSTVTGFAKHGFAHGVRSSVPPGETFEARRPHCHPRLCGESGSILVLTVLIIFAVSVIATMVSVVSSMDLKISGNHRMATAALSVAEAGLSEALHRVALPSPTIASVGDWSGDIAIADNEPYDPDWEYRIYLTAPGSAPSAGGEVVTTGTIQNPERKYLQYSHSTGDVDVLTIRHKWKDRDADNVRDADEIVRYDSDRSPPENFTSGCPVEVVTVTGRWGPARRTIQAEVTRRSSGTRTLGGLVVNNPVHMQGHPDVCGWNHAANMPAGTRPRACFAWHVGTDNLPAIATTGYPVSIEGAPRLEGKPAAIDTSQTNMFSTVAEVIGVSERELKKILANADHTAASDTLNGITFLDGDHTIAGNATGRGLLYVSGDLTVSGDFDYRGLVYVEGELKVTGSPWIVGGVMIGDNGGEGRFQAGGAGILYSKETIEKSLREHLPLLVLSWREL